VNTSYKFLAHFLTAALAIVSLSPSSRAQNLNVTGAINVPFAFETGYKHFAPGRYTIHMESANILSIHGANGSGLVMTRQGADQQPARWSKAVFRKAGNQYFLGEIWFANKGGHLDVVKSKAEVQRQIAADRTAPQRVELAMLGGGVQLR
jgi:hypothetical protein